MIYKNYMKLCNRSHGYWLIVLKYIGRILRYVFFKAPKKQTPSFEGMGRIYFNLAELFCPSGRTLFREHGNTVEADYQNLEFLID